MTIENKLGEMGVNQDTYGCNSEIVVKREGLRGYEFIHSNCGSKIGNDIYYCSLCARGINIRVPK